MGPRPRPLLRVVKICAPRGARTTVVPRRRGGPAHRETAQTRPGRSPGAGRLCPDGALNLHRDCLPAGTIGPIRGQGLPFRTGSGNAPRFPRPRGTVPRGPAGPGVTEASARPGGREAPARGGAGAGRGALWAPRRDKGRRGAGAEATAFARVTGHPREHPFGREQETHRVSPAPARRCHADRQVREGQRPAPDPAGAKRPPVAGRPLAGGFGPRPVKDPRSAVAGAMATARMHTARAGRGVCRLALRQLGRQARLQQPVNAR